MKNNCFKNVIVCLSFLIVVFLTVPVKANQFALPANGNTLLGSVQFTKAGATDTTTSVAHRYNLGLNAIVAANPGTTEQRLGSRQLKIPTALLLPPTKHEGIVINLPEMRLYYFPEDSDQVMVFPIGIGKIGNTIPIQNTIVSRKTLNPTWTPGPDARKYNEEQGISLPRVMPPGPDNPLGPYAIYLNIPSFLIHSTIFPESIGRRASFGCIRMNESDIKDFYPIVKTGTQVFILNMPDKIGWNNNELFLEAHPPLEEHHPGAKVLRDNMVDAVKNFLPSNQLALVNWPLVAHLAEEPDGIPHDIGIKISN